MHIPLGIFLSVLTVIAIHSYVDQFELECTRKEGIIITHRGNIFCVKGHEVLEWVLDK